jgi:uncharacterized phiE125 gp8 family phage protein
MMLSEMTTVPGAALPLQGLKDHLRLGSGFTEDGLQDGLLEAHLRAAITAIEGRVGKVLLQRRFRLTVEDWRAVSEQPLPVAPVVAVVSVTIVDAAEGATLVPVDRYKLVKDTHRPKLAAVGVLLPVVPMDGRAEVVFDAGFGAAWSGVPADLAQAVFMLAAEYYEQRQPTDFGSTGLPHAVQALIERWRTVRILGGKP